MSTSISTEQVVEFCRSHGFSPGAVKPIPIGQFNRSFYVRTTYGPDLVLRIAPSETTGFVFYERGMMAQEPEIHEIVRRRTDLPVPEVLLFDDSRKILDRDAILLERLPGRAMYGRRLAHEAVDRTVEQLGAYLRTLHTRCTARQFGYLGAHAPMTPADTWVDAFEEMWERLIDDLEGCGVYLPEDGDLARRALSGHLERFDFDRPASLLHMDIWTQNILVDNEGTITGIVDWDRALWGDPEIEFAVLDYCGFDTDAFWRGYGGRPDRTGDANIRHHFYMLYEIQKYPVIWTRRGGRSRQIARYREHCLSLLRELDSGGST